MLPPYTTQVISGFGVNYPNARANWLNNIKDYLAWGVKYMRAVGHSLPYPFVLGDPNVPDTLAESLLCAQTFMEAGIYASWGPGGLSGARGPGQLNSTNWINYHDSVVALAVYLQASGIVLGDFQLGNELESDIDNTTLTVAQLHANLRQLAIDVKAEYSLSPIMYAADDALGITYNDWISSGIGEIDYLSIHPYGSINVTNQTVTPTGFSSIQKVFQAFGERAYISEFNLDPNGSNIASLNQYAQVTVMQNFLNTYILPVKPRIFMIYTYVENQDNNPPDFGFAQLRPDGTFNPMWSVFFTRRSTLKPKLTAQSTPLINSFEGGSPTALVDDPVYLVDDPNILSGNQTVPLVGQRIGTNSNAPRGTSRKRR